MSKITLPIPDLRFENSFRRSLRNYAKASQKTEKISTTSAEKQDDLELTPITEPITLGVVLYAIIKDQVIMQFVSGFGMAVFFMLLTPYLRYLANSGKRWGLFTRNKLVNVFNSIGISSSRKTKYIPNFAL